MQNQEGREKAKGEREAQGHAEDSEFMQNWLTCQSYKNIKY